MAWWKLWGNRDAAPTPDYYEEGVALVAQERYHDALTSFRLALREQPDDPATLEQMAVVFTRIGLTDEAVKMYLKSLEARPDSPSAHYGIAFLLLKQGDRAAAISHLERFLASDTGAEEMVKPAQHARETLLRLAAEHESERVFEGEEEAGDG
ncbi:MAG: tetratricopeptide repeat protein [Gemmatimonadota bacterium]